MTDREYWKQAWKDRRDEFVREYFKWDAPERKRDNKMLVLHYGRLFRKMRG